jgi:hypothetical protein
MTPSVAYAVAVLLGLSRLLADAATQAPMRPHRGSMRLTAVHPVTLNQENVLSVDGQPDAWPSIPVATSYAPLAVHTRLRTDASR